MASTHNIKFWRGTRRDYNSLVIAGKTDPYTHYSVKEADGTWNTFYGVVKTTLTPGQLEPVECVTSFSKLYMDYASTPDAISGKRFLILDDGNYFVTEMGDCTGAFRIVSSVALGDRSVRIKNGKYQCGELSLDCANKEFQLIDGVLMTYDDVDGGDF